jgi:hypothetical protein
MFVEGRVTDTKGNPIAGAVIDTWETDGSGLYDTQVRWRPFHKYPSQQLNEYSMPHEMNQIVGDDYILQKMDITLSEPSCAYDLLSITLSSVLIDSRPVGYSIPNDGPVGALLKQLKRHTFRPAHLHMMIKASFYLHLHTQRRLTFFFLTFDQAPGYEKLITALYFEGEHLTSDAVFGVRASLIVVCLVALSWFKSSLVIMQHPEVITDGSITKNRGFRESKSHLFLKHDFVLATEEEAREARNAAMLAITA